MTLPFTHEEFLAVFAAYNQQWWIAAVLLWALTAATAWWAYRRGDSANQALTIVLALLWAWGGAVYHLQFFRPINPAATIFGGLFLLQSVVLAWTAFHGGLRPARTPSVWSRLGVGLLAFGLFYPGVILIAGLRYPAMPTFGVPCPTAIVTAGVLLLVPPRSNRLITLVTIIWAIVGGSAAFVLGVWPDVVLLLAGVALVAYQVTPRTGS